MNKKPQESQAKDDQQKKEQDGTPPNAQGSSGGAATQPGQSDGGTAEVNEHGFPDNTPTSEMTADQQAAYWKHKARKWEGRARDQSDYESVKEELNELKKKQMSESERAIEDAREEGRTEASQEFGEKMVEASLRGALAGRGIEVDDIDSKLSYVDFSKFLDNNGEVDSDKVQRYIADVAPQQNETRWPDMGQGRRHDVQDRRSGGSVEAGRKIRQERQKLSKR